MKTEKIEGPYIDEHGVLHVNVCEDAASDDWIRAGRLSERAKRGDKKAAKKHAELEATPMLRTVDG